ncbi:right-handed parallel beta-helix repeat-containing protein [Malonomonas rubra]|uniref:right-handed parallel beta-helix repeat-containing protein n=1 Tax=Malonomonas rubra TaxID=57040 RepID=UPI0026F244B0|nr:right-handed parallel beta-helix repeat-containing protein [Malonomonas rubra]
MTRLLLRLLFYILLLVPLGLLPSCAMKPIVQGDLQGQIEWRGEVYLRGNVILVEDAVLTIAPGTKVFFLPLAPSEDELSEHPYFPGSELIVRGKLLAEGTADAPISFQYIEASAPPGSWGGINIEGSPQARFEYSVFRQADSAVHARESWVVVENSRFANNLVGVRFHDTKMLIEKNLFENNGAAIRFHFGAPVICKNLIRNNDKGLFISSAPQDYKIENNSFIDNRIYEVSLGEGVRKQVVLKKNFWGGHTAKSLPTRFYDGRIDDWLGIIDYLPMRSNPDPDARDRWNR